MDHTTLPVLFALIIIAWISLGVVIIVQQKITRKHIDNRIPQELLDIREHHLATAAPKLFDQDKD